MFLQSQETTLFSSILSLFGDLKVFSIMGVLIYNNKTMKLINRKEFLQMPAYTIFTYWNEKSPLQEFEIGVKGCEPGTFSNDFLVQGLVTLGADFIGFDNRKIAKAKLIEGESIPIEEDWYSRDGMFKDDEKYLIYEKEDLEKMINLLTKGLGLK